MWFLSKALLALTLESSRSIEEITDKPLDYRDRPMILTGDFNVKFSLSDSKPLLNFLENKFSLRMISSRNYLTTKSDTTINIIFARNLENIEINYFIFYFSYHTPLSA